MPQKNTEFSIFETHRRLLLKIFRPSPRLYQTTVCPRIMLFCNREKHFSTVRGVEQIFLSGAASLEPLKRATKSTSQCNCSLGRTGVLIHVREGEELVSILDHMLRASVPRLIIALCAWIEQPGIRLTAESCYVCTW